MADQRVIKGIGAAAGASVGPAIVVDRPEVVVPDLPQPIEALQSAMVAVADALTTMATAARKRNQDEAAQVLDAQALMAQDPMLSSAVEAKLGESQPLGQALAESGAELRAMLQGLDDPYLAARADDIAEVVDRVSCHLAGVPAQGLGELTEPSILVGKNLTAAEISQIDPEMVVGIITETGGPTSHVVIIARSIGVPAVVGIGEHDGVSSGDIVALDGASGDVVFRPSDDVVTDFTARAERYQAEVAAAATWRGRQASFGDSPMSIPANVANEADLQRAIDEQADGIGLLRTEFLFLDRPTAPSEEEQYDFYARAAAAFDAPVVIRTFDIGGDKAVGYLSIDGEENPFLGVRGARLYTRHEQVFESQVRAILRAAVHGDVWMMIPMVTTTEEIVELTARVERVAAGFDDQSSIRMPKFGAMVEVPALALTADAAAAELDFFSIGSNDLTQYTMAADRTNESLGQLQDALHPSVLALCHLVVGAAKRAEIPVSVCGLSAADPAGAAVYAAMGIDKLSVSGAMVNPTKAVVSSLDPEAGRSVVEEVLRCGSTDEVRELIDRWRTPA